MTIRDDPVTADTIEKLVRTTAARNASEKSGSHSAAARRTLADNPMIAHWQTGVVGIAGNAEDLSDRLLYELRKMASKSSRWQADVDAAVKRGGIVALPEELRAALASLEASRYVRALINLYDGGLLLTVTALGMERVKQLLHSRDFGQPLKPDF